MSPEEWLGIVRWLSSVNVKWTADVAVKYGTALQRLEAADVRQACASLVDKRLGVTVQSIRSEIRRRPSKFGGLLEQRHRELHPNGCASPICDLCVDTTASAR